MGELSFRYDVKYKQKLLHAFRYWHEKTIQYGFAYQRFVALYDTRIFDSPVVITKVATGLSNVFNLFVYPRQSFDMETLNGFNIEKDGKSIEYPEKYQSFFIHKDGKSFLIKDDKFLYHNTTFDTNYINDSVFGYWKHGLNIYENLNGKPHLIISNIYENPLGRPHDNILNEIPDILGRSNEYITNIFLTMLGTPEEKHGEFIYDAFGMPNEIRTNIIDTIIGTPNDIVLNYYDFSNLEIINNDVLQYFENLYAYLERKYVDLDAIYFLYKAGYASDINQMRNNYIVNPKVSYFKDDSFIWKATYHSNLNTTISAYKSMYLSIKNHATHDVYRFDPRAFYEYYISYGSRSEYIGFYDYYTRFGNRENKYADKHQDYRVYRHYLFSDVNDTLQGYRQIFTGSINQELFSYFDTKYGKLSQHYWAINKEKLGNYFRNVHVSQDIKYALIDDQLVSMKDIAFGDMYIANHFVTRTYSDLSLTQNVFVTMDRKSIFMTQTLLWSIRKSSELFRASNVFADKLSNEFQIINTKFFAYKDKLSSQLYQSNIFYNKDRKQLLLSNNMVFIHKESFGIDVYTSNAYVYKIRKELNIQSTKTMVNKTSHGIFTTDGLNTFRKAYGIFINNIYTNTERISYDVNTMQSGLSIEKINNNALLSNAVQLYLKKKDTRYYESAMSLLKLSVSVSNIGALESALKTIWHVRLNNFSNNHNGLIIPVTKNNVDVTTFNKDINSFAYKIVKDIMVSPNAMASILQKPLSMDTLNYLGAEKLYLDIMMDVYNYFAEKQAVKLSIFKQLHGYRLPYDLTITDNLHALKDSQILSIYQNIQALKEVGNLSIYDTNIWTNKVSYDMTLYKQLFTDKNRAGIYYFYDVWSTKSRQDVSIYSQVQSVMESKDLILYNLMPTFDVSREMNIYDTVVYGIDSTKDINIMQQLEIVEKRRKEIEEFLSDFGNWAWVYETPDPFTSTHFGIDELLLPETDPRYEDFENIIFDRETLTPRDPIKVLGPTSFLARYPIDIPIEEFADIGAIYEDSAEKWEQYFGIETDVMREIYLKYYQIWQAKIFEFSTMTMVQSTKKMLEYLYTWIDMYFPVEKMQQALRVFRQIRWFSESAIIKNSQYVISYEYDTLKSNLHKGQCDIPSSLDDLITNPSMYIDQKNAVIRNNKAFLNQDAFVEFYIDAPKNTYIKFDLYNEYGKGTAMVYLNDVLVSIHTNTNLGIIVQIPYTGTTNRVKIMKDAINNIGEFYVGNISIPNASFKDLSIEFDPVLRAGNKPLEEVAQKMIACANLYADRNEMYAVIKRSSLGFSETYKQMNDYWNLHHKNKTKGKRLTIKQT